MNKLKGTIAEIDSFEHLSLVMVQVGDNLFSSIIINTPKTSAFCQVGREIYIVFKETEVAIGKNLSGELSLRNRFRAQIKEIASGKVLTQLALQFKNYTIHSIITSRAAKEMDLQINDWVEGMVKTNEVTLMQL